MVETESSALRRGMALCVVAILHVGVLAFLTSGMAPRVYPTPALARLIVERRKPPLEPPPIPAPILTPPATFVPAPEISVAAPAARVARTTVIRAAPAEVPSGHFGTATDTGLELDVGTAKGGGGADRGSLAQFEATVRRQVLAGKRQPALAWDKRNTCVVGYTVHVGPAGRLASFSIDACAVPEINAAARAAIQAATFPPPPNLGAADYEVHGSLVFHP